MTAFVLQGHICYVKLKWTLIEINLNILKNVRIYIKKYISATKSEIKINYLDIKNEHNIIKWLKL